MVKNVRLYYYTGTGNSYRAAQWMAETARERGLPAQVTPVSAANPATEIDANTLLGLLYPVHGFTAPWTMLRFVFRLPRSQGTPVFTAMPRGALRFGNVTIPGLEGSGNYLVLLILLLKGYRPRGAMGLDMPGSWLALLPGLPPAAVQAMLTAMEPKIKGFMAAILDGQTRFKSLIPLLFGLLLLPVSFLYLIMGRLFLAKLFYASPRCNGCGLCVENCPMHGVVMKKGRPFWTFRCESCTRCMNYCPHQAIEASYPFAALFLYLGGLPAAALLLEGLERAGLAVDGPLRPWLETIINYPYKLLALALAYVGFAALLHVRAINAVLTALTPTRYYRRYHEPGVKLKDLG